jgi:hypothetical protein
MNCRIGASLASSDETSRKLVRESDLMETRYR